MRICEIFYSLQGEGILTGVPSLFIRTAGCNLKCRWCDTPYAHNPDSGTEMSLDAVCERLAEWPHARHCVITGGEPMLATELPELTRRLASAGYHITIETNATIDPGEATFHLASLSPKLRHAGPNTPAIDLQRLRRWMQQGESQLKIVSTGTADLPEIMALQSALADCLPPDRILLMPLTTADAQETQKRRASVVQLCLHHGFRYAHRLHLELFEGRRGA